MKKYLVIGHNSTPTTPDQLTPQQQQAWTDFFSTLGDRIVDGGNPLADRAVIKDGKVATVADSPVGYYMMSAENLDEACKLVMTSPFSNAPGCEVRIYETIPM